MKRRFIAALWGAASAVAVLLLALAWWLFAPHAPAPSSVARLEQTSVYLSPKDRERLASLPVLRMGYVPRWSPLSFFSKEEGRLSGVAGDYADKLSSVLGLRLELVPVEDITDLQRLMLERKVDIVPLMGPWHDVGRGFIYSEPYLLLPEVFVTRLSHEAASFPDSLVGKTIVTAAPRITRENLRRSIPGVSIFQVKNARAGLDMVRDGAVDAYVGNLAIVDGLLRGNYQYSLRIAGQTGIVLPLSFAVSDKYAWLVPLVDRMVESISPMSRRQVLNSWTAVRYDPTVVDWHEVARTLLPVGAAAALVLSFLFFAYLYYRKEALQRRAAEEKLKAVTKHLPAVVFQARKASVHELVFDYVSGNSSEIWGLRPDEMRENPWKFLERIVPEDIDAFEQETRRAEETQTPFLLEFRVQRTPDEIRWIRGNAVPSHGSTGETVWSGYWVDISDIKQQAVQLQAARDLAEQATQSKTHFLAVMSHEIRTPLNGVIGMLELLRRTDMTAPQSSMAATIDESANNLLGLLDEILDLSKIEAGHMELRPQLVDVRGVVDDVVRLFNATAQSKGLRLRVLVDAAVPLEIQADPLRLRQVLSNLLSNAIKFTNEGEIDVELSLVARNREVSTALLRFVVTDTGVGIAPDVQKKLFQPYAQGTGALGMKATPGGTGLGLSICRRIAEAMGGTITLRSREHVGARATLEAEFPVSAVPPAFETTYRRVYLSIGDETVARSLREYLLALGLGERLQDDQRGRSVHDDDEPWIAFTLDDWAGIIGVSRWNSEEEVRIDAHPLSWRDVLGIVSEQAEPEAQPQNWDESNGGDALRILVAEDHAVSRQLLASQLESFGCDVVACEDGQEAWNELMEDASYDLLITDGHMPRMDGLSLCRRLRSSDLPWLRQLPILIMSATPLDIPEDLASAPGRIRALLKPLKLRDLGNAIARVVSTGGRAKSTPRTAAPAPAKALQAKSFLQEFADAIVADQKQLPDLFAAADVAGMKRWVHRQAGALATMGLLALTDQAQALERRLEGLPGEEAVLAVQAFNQSLSDAVDGIRASA
ncbi:hypothetical protein MyNCGM683_06660 [Achromobacter xylosoxidans]